MMEEWKYGQSQSGSVRCTFASGTNSLLFMVMWQLDGLFLLPSLVTWAQMIMFLIFWYLKALVPECIDVASQLLNNAVLWMVHAHLFHVPSWQGYEMCLKRQWLEKRHSNICSAQNRSVPCYFPNHLRSKRTGLDHLSIQCVVTWNQRPD